MPNVPWQKLMALLLVASTGCVAVKDDVPQTPPATLSDHWQPRYASSVCIRIPTSEAYAGITSQWEREEKMERDRSDANRLAEILAKCRLFKGVTVSDVVTNDLVIQALPNVPYYEDADNAWLLMYGTVVPIWDHYNEGVRFKFLQSDTNEFVFPWTRQTVFGFWAPVFAVAPGWHFGIVAPPPTDSPYWSDLRAALIKEMDQTDLQNKMNPH